MASGSFSRRRNFFVPSGVFDVLLRYFGALPSTKQRLAGAALFYRWRSKFGGIDASMIARMS